MKRSALFTTLPLLCLALSLSQASCAFLSSVLQKPNVTLRAVNLTEVSFNGIGANFVMGVDNPNPIGLDLASLGYQLNVDGHQFAAGQANQAVSVPANGSGEITLPVSIKFGDFIQSLQSLISKPQLPYSLATTLGFASPIGTIEVPLATQGTFPVPRLPSIGFSGVSMGGVDMTGATINLGIALSNPNAFALPLGTLNYQVTVAGSPVIQNAAPAQTLAANGSQSLPLQARIDFFKTGAGIMNAIRGGSATIAFDGALDLGLWKHPVHLEQRLSQ